MTHPPNADAATNVRSGRGLSGLSQGHFSPEKGRTVEPKPNCVPSLKAKAAPW